MNQDSERLEEFDSRIAGIHETDPHRSNSTHGRARDIRHLEFKAMTDVFLGMDYDQATLAEVEELQIQLDTDALQLAKKLDAETISPEGYLQSVKALNLEIFTKIQSLLGEADFLRLFGGPPTFANELIDDESFLRRATGR